MAAELTWTVIEPSDSHSESSLELILHRGEESWEWLKQVILGEFDEDRELSAILADMTISIVLGVIIITSARDMIAIIARLSLHPERQKEVMEWVLLFGTVGPIAYPLIAAGLGVGAVVTDPIGRLKAASTPLGNETFAFDPVGNLIDPELLQNTEQHHDSQPINTRWDDVREEVKFDYRQLPKVMGNLLERYAGTHYQYDECGNRRRQTEPSGHTTEYLYDADDRLIEVKRYRRAPAAGDTTPPEMHAKYGYDGFGRRLWKLVKDGKAKPKLTVFSWDANLLTSEEVFEGEFHFWDTFAYPQEPELEPEDPSKKFSLPIAQRVHTLTARALKRTHWLYEPDSFVPAAQLAETYDQHAQRMTGTGQAASSSHMSASNASVEPQLYYIHTDHLGTPQELTDRDGNLQWVGRYRAWGELAKANDSEGNTTNVEMSLRFQGQYFDAETRLHYNRFGYYDPQVGRFTTQDPISLAGGINLYQYAPNPI